MISSFDQYIFIYIAKNEKYVCVGTKFVGGGFVVGLVVFFKEGLDNGRGKVVGNDGVMRKGDVGVARMVAKVLTPNFQCIIS